MATQSQFKEPRYPAVDGAYFSLKVIWKIRNIGISLLSFHFVEISEGLSSENKTKAVLFSELGTRKELAAIVGIL